MQQNILDAVAGQAKELQRTVGARDRDRLDQYFSSVRDLEQRMQMSREWEDRPKPKVSAPVPLDAADPKAYMDKVKLMYDMARLAFETDSTRSISLLLDSVNSPAIEFGDVKTSDGYHNLSHHGKSKEKLAQLKAIDEWHMKLLAELFGQLKAVREDGEPLLDRTMILYGSNLGNANTHVTTNLPVLFAGGGFKHGQHLARRRECQTARVHIVEAARMGADICTCPAKVIDQLFNHPLTNVGLENFLKDWEKSQAVKA